MSVRSGADLELQPLDRIAKIARRVIRESSEMKLSVALASYNGSRFFAEQLQSIQDQSVLPDELVISDDASTDNTLEIAQRFAQTAPFLVRVISNKSTVGYTQNFERALRWCTGDVIFLSDQDDIWVREKIERLQYAKIENPRSRLILSNGEFIGKDGAPLGETILGRMRKLGYSSDALVKGCCMAVDRSLIDLALPLMHTTGHDNWISALAQRLQVKHVIRDVLVKYRIHGDNVSGFLARETGPVNRRDRVKVWASVNSREQLIARAKFVEAIKSRFQERAALPPQVFTTAQLDDALAMAAEELAAINGRADLLQKARPRRVLPATRMFLNGGYRHFSGAVSYGKDLVKR